MTAHQAPRHGRGLGCVTEPDRLPRSFFAADAATLARALLGQRLVRRLQDGTRLTGVIVETEAYLGARDRASHAFGGRRTARNESMYAGPGTAYVYFTYGMHFCFNVVCSRKDDPQAVLIRALEPAEGVAFMRESRSRRRASTVRDHDLCAGPARLCQALAIDRLLDGVDVVTSMSLWLEAGAPVPDAIVRRSARIGVDYSGAWARRRLRWLVPGSPHVSVPLHPRARRMRRMFASI